MGLPKLTSYERGVELSEDYWSHWPYNGTLVGSSKIDGVKLKIMALEAGYKDLETLEKASTDLVDGARIDCIG